MKTFVYYIFLALLVTSYWSCKKEDINNPLDKTKPFEMPCDYLTQDRVLKNDPDKPVDYVVKCVMFLDGKITIEPGTVIQFEDETGWAVQSNGSLNATGTADNPILFTGKTKRRGSWRGLYFESTNVNNRLVHCIVEFGGGSAFNSNDDRGGIIMYARSRLYMERVLVRESNTYGLNAAYGETNLEIKNCQFKGNREEPVLILFDYLQRLDNGSDYTGNGKDQIKVFASVLESNMTLKKLNVPYFLKSRPFGFSFIVGPANWRIDPGVQIIADDQVDITVTPGGSITAVGSAADPITFTSTTKIPGAWAGLYIQDSKSVNNILENAIVEYAGDGTHHGRAAITLWASPRLTVRNTTFRNLQYCPLFIHGEPTNPAIVLENNTLINVAGTAELCHD